MEKYVQLLESTKSHLLESNAPIVFERIGDGRFEIKGNELKVPVITNVIICPLSEMLTEDKLNGCKRKVIKAAIVVSDGKMIETSLSHEEVSFAGFKELLFSVPKYGCVSDTEYSAIYKLFTSIASCGLKSETVYNVPGLTLDNKLFIFNGVKLEIQAESVLTEQEKADSLEAFNMLMSCCTEEKSLLLLELLMISTVFEVIKQMSVTDMRNCLPTFVPYLYGESGVGKTTIIKAFFAEMDECNRFVSLANATASGILKKISSICSGMVIVDDVPHTSANKCSKKAMDSLEAVIRTYGDVGAEKVTAVGDMRQTRSWVLVTAEEVFMSIKSSILRTLPIEIEKGEVNFDVIETLKSNKSKFNTLMLSYIKWFFNKAKFNGQVWQIDSLSELYKHYRDEMQSQYCGVESRIYDSHCQIMMYHKLFSSFFREIGIPPDKIAELKTTLQRLLLGITKQQMLYCYENTLPYYIRLYISDIIEANNIAELKPRGSDGYAVEPNAYDCCAFKNESYLYFTSESKQGQSQKNRFFDGIIKYAQCIGNIKRKDIKSAMLKMGIVCKPFDKKPVEIFPKGNDDRIKINNNLVHVLCIKFKEEDYYEKHY